MPTLCGKSTESTKNPESNDCGTDDVEMGNQMPVVCSKWIK